MNDIMHAIVGALLVIYAPLPLIALMRCVVNWNRAVYVRDLFKEATYSNDTDNKLDADEFSWSMLLKFPFMAYFVLMVDLSHFVKYIVMKSFGRPLNMMKKAMRKVGHIKIKK